MNPERSRLRSRAGITITAVAGLSLVATAAGAAVVAGEDQTALGNAVVSGATLTGASQAVDFPCEADDPTTTEDESLCPTGIGNTPLAGFPTHGSTYGVLTTGNAAYADDPNTSTSTGYSWGVADSPIAGVKDQQVVRLDLGAATGNCLAFDFKFFSEEFPEFVTAGYNDAFVAQLNTWAVAKDPASQAIIAPGDFAAGAGDTISVDASGPSAMSAEQAAGTTYDGATLSLVARKLVTPGATNSLYLTIFDQGDGIYDTAVFFDNVRYETLPASQCKSLALDPYEGTTGVSPLATSPTWGPNNSTISLPVACNLPPGPIGCNVTANATFTPWGQKVPRAAAQAATVPLASGSASIAAGATGTLTLTTNPTGLKAIKAAKAEPAKMKKQAKKLAKKAKTAAPAKAKKLNKKAKKLKKKAKQYKKSPAGTLSITVSNASNGASEVLKFPVKR